MHPRRPSAVALVATLVACAPDGPSPIPWTELRNPVVGLDDRAVKDAFAVRGDDAWHLGYSDIRDDPFRFRVGRARTGDWRSFEFADVLDDDDVGGFASPDVVRAPDEGWIMVHNSHTHDVGAALNKLYFRTSTDLSTWSDAQRVVIEGADADDDRVIDGALAFADAGAFLFFKREQAAWVAHAPSGDVAGPWTALGAIDPVNLENIQVLRIDGEWHLLGTTIPVEHRPQLHRLDGDPDDPQAWRTWTVVDTLRVPAEEWNDGEVPGSERSNAAYLIDERAIDGFFYLLYAGSTELTSFEGRGHARLGLARSADLVDWAVPP